jgi:PAS domain S-box-containing protein
MGKRAPKKKPAKKVNQKKTTSTRKTTIANKSTRASEIISKKQTAKTPQALRINLPLSRIGLWEYHPDDDRIFWSENAHRFFHLPDSRSLPTTLETLVPLIYDDDQGGFREQFSTVLTEGAELLIHVRMKVQGGNFIWLEFSGNRDKGTKNKPKPVIGTVLDVTDHKITEYELVDWKTRNELVSESAGLLIYDYDLITNKIIWSGNTEQVVGFTQEEMGDIRQWEELIHPDDREGANRALEKAKKELKPYDFYYRFRVKNADYCYMHDRGLFVRNGNGEAVRMLGIMSDVSERVTATRTIEQSEKSYRELFNCVGEAIYIQRPDGTFIDVNREACAIYGYTKEEMIGKTPEFLSAPGRNDFEKLGKQIDEALRGKPQSFHWWGKRKNGEVFLKEVKLTKGTYFGAETVIATAVDITEKVKGQQTLLESEKRFRRMIEDLNVGVVLLGPDQEVQIANRAALTLLHTTEQRLEKKGLRHGEWGFLTSEGKPKPPERLPWVVAAREKKPVRGLVVGLQEPDSNMPSWLLVNAEPTLLDQEKLLHVLITFTDITEQKRIAQNLRESELRFRTLQEASFGGIGLHNKGLLLDCNQGLCDLTGYTYDELIGSNGLLLIAPEYRDYVLDKIISKEERPYDVVGLRKDGSRYFLEIHGKNIPFGEGLIRVTEFRDITDRKLSEAELTEQNAKLVAITDTLKQKNEQLQEFTQIVSHNLRSPVGNILSLLNFIEHAENDEERSEYITLLKEAGTTTLTTLQELNEVLQIKQNRNVQRQTLQFEEVFENVRRMLNAKIAEARAEIVTDFHEAPTIAYPNIYLESIILNLVSNALKYKHPDRRPVIRITSSIENGIVTLTIADNGSGLNMQRYGHQIFQLRKTFHKHPESRGIGLFMIKNQIEAMGGDISLSSIENEGTTFRINFTNTSQE